MARVTVEDCVTKIPNRFELVLLASQRAKELSSGASLTVERDNDKNSVVALREIAEETVAVEDIKNNLVSGMQRYIKVQENVDEEMEIKAAEAELAGESTDFSNIKEEAFVEGADSIEISEEP